MKQLSYIKGEMWNKKKHRKGRKESWSGEGKPKKGGKKGHLYLGEHHLKKLQQSAIKKLKLSNCWVTTATKRLIKAGSRAEKVRE